MTQVGVGLNEDDFWNACCDLHVRAGKGNDLNFQVKLFEVS